MGSWVKCYLLKIHVHICQFHYFIEIWADVIKVALKWLFPNMNLRKT